jgi:predicted AAA+ superfamily ATPase
MRAIEIKKQYNEVQLLNIIWNLSLESQNGFNNIYKEADFLKAPNAKKLSRQTLSKYLHGLQDRGLIKKIQNKWFLTIEGYKTLARKIKPRALKSINILVPLEKGSITIQEAMELNLITPQLIARPKREREKALAS